MHKEKACSSIEKFSDTSKAHPAFDTSHDKQTENKTLFEWSVKSIKFPPKEISGLQFLVLGAGTAFGLYSAWVMKGLPNYAIEVILGFATSYSITFLLILLLRQKTVFIYNVGSQKALLQHYKYYPNFAAPLFKGIAIFTILLFLGVALFSGSLLFLIGPAAIALGSARFLLNWENKIHHEQSLPWNEHNFVTVDRKRSMIIIHCTDTTVGFEARLPNEDLFEQYLQFLHSVLPPTAEFTEKAWEW
ncbi:hypothetical protein ALQ04_00676 [Pseudomonas cichorii]|uniref:Permease n=1 Tax=Pseudomonas cichorii TaxID=36746 RepID=A0A3M4LV45_PSECI|nr:permease [Pseudomonas cichorii]RMQ45388.1 hypothetical protein ALQ04_00676 [Pseudomonas cichorii]